MIQLRPGDLVRMERSSSIIEFAILTRQIYFGGHWCYVFYGAASANVQTQSDGFNAFVDFIVPKREKRISHISRGNDFSTLLGPELLKIEPLEGKTHYGICRWRNGERERVEPVRTTESPTRDELLAPHYVCMSAESVFDLAIKRWRLSDRLWVA